MVSSQEIRYLKRGEIDIDRWDKCIDNADNGLIYAYIMCDNWDALVWNDYEAVMPLPWRKKWGIKYVYQVPFIQRLGIFGSCSAEIIKSFYQKAAEKFKLLHYKVSEWVPTANVTKKQNFIIPLNQPYEKIHSSYNKECLVNIQKARTRNCRFTNEVEAAEVILCYQNAYGHKNNRLQHGEYTKLNSLLLEAKRRNVVDFLGVQNDQQDHIYAAAIFRDQRRLYYILGAPTEEGREKRATYFFIDYLLKEEANTARLFDFEGSDIPNVATFYQKFGPQTEYYYEIKMQRFFPFR